MAEKILVVDDEKELPFLFKRKFKEQIESGLYQLYFAENGKEALDVIVEQPEISIVLSDINMPVMDGLQLMKEIGKLERLIVVVVVSAYGDIDNVRQTMQNGGFDFITKPIDFKDVEITIEKARKHVDAIRKSEAAVIEAEESLRLSEESHRKLVEKSPDAILVHTEEKIVFMNESALALLGVQSKDQVDEQAFSDLFEGEDRWKVVSYIRKIERNISSQPLVTHLKRTDGSKAMVSMVGVSYTFEGKSSILQNIRDLSKEQKYEQTLEKITRRTDILLQSSINGFVLLNLKGDFLEVNQAFLTLLGYSEDELIGMNINDIGDKFSDIPRGMERIIAHGPVVFDARLWTSQKKLIDVEVRAQHFQEEGKSLVIAFVQDITDRKTAEKALREQSNFLEVLIDTIPTPIYHKAVDGRYKICNEAYAKFVGLKKSEILGKTIKEISSPELAEEAIIRDQELFAGGGEQSFESRTSYANGEERDVFFHKAAFYNSDGEITGLVGTLLDISARKKAEAENARLATAIHQSAECVIVTDVDSTIEYVNPRFSEVTGYKASEVLGEKMSILQSGIHGKEFFKGLWDTIKSKKVWSGRIVNQKKDGSLIEEDMSISPVLSDDDEITKYVCIQRDMTYEIQLEKHIRESHKLEAIGTLAGGIAHDFNNLLFAMLLSIKLVQDELKEEDEHKALLSQAYDAGQRAKELVKQILIFSHQEEQELQTIELVPVIEESMQLLRSTLPTTIEIEMELPDNACTIQGDPTQIQQLVMNLGTNAGYVMEATGGKLSISVMKEVIKAKQGHLMNLKPGVYLKLIVQDTGSGISEEIRERLFEPFFTTKPVGEGTGLGLAVVHGIVKRHQGTILLDSSYNQGARFNIYLPVNCADEESSIVSGNGVNEELPSDVGGYLMIVDDEEMVATLQKRMLERFGYRVKDFTCSREALAYFSEHSEEFDLVLTDQTMPTMTGEQLGRAIKALREDIPIVIVTGYSSVVDAEIAKEAGIDGFLMKPVAESKLMKTVHRLITEYKEKRA